MISNSKTNKTDKWYDSPGLVDTLLLVFPPIGFFALLKSKKIVPKPIKIVTGVFLFRGICVLLYLFINN